MIMTPPDRAKDHLAMYGVEDMEVWLTKTICVTHMNCQMLATALLSDTQKLVKSGFKDQAYININRVKYIINYDRLNNHP